MSHREQPDRPPDRSARNLLDGVPRFGTTGQLWVARKGAWVRVAQPTAAEIERAKKPLTAADYDQAGD
jgi:hypothetical protein